jgi:hypothetical protein
MEFLLRLIVYVIIVVYLIEQITNNEKIFNFNPTKVLTHIDKTSVTNKLFW